MIWCIAISCIKPSADDPSDLCLSSLSKRCFKKEEFFACSCFFFKDLVSALQLQYSDMCGDLGKVLHTWKQTYSYYLWLQAFPVVFYLWLSFACISTTSNLKWFKICYVQNEKIRCKVYSKLSDAALLDALTSGIRVYPELICVCFSMACSCSLTTWSERDIHYVQNLLLARKRFRHIQAD